MKNTNGLQPFKPGNDPRRNTKGRPKNLKQLRALAISIADEPVKDGSDITRIERMLREMAKSDNPSSQALLLKYAFGNVPDEFEGKNKSKVEIIVKYANSDRNTPDAT